MPNRKCIRRVRLMNPHGLHLRPAKLLCDVAQRFDCEIFVSCGDRTANAKSILELFRLAAECGSILVIEARGARATEALNCLEATILGKIVMEEFAPLTRANRLLAGTKNYDKRDV